MTTDTPSRIERESNHETPQSDEDYLSPSTLRIYQDQYGWDEDVRVMRWQLGGLYANARYTPDSECVTPQRKRKRSESPDDDHSAQSKTRGTPSVARAIASPFSSPCERVTRRKSAPSSIEQLKPMGPGNPYSDLPSDLPCPDSVDVTADWTSLLVHNAQKLKKQNRILSEMLDVLQEELEMANAEIRRLQRD